MMMMMIIIIIFIIIIVHNRIVSLSGGGHNKELRDGVMNIIWLCDIIFRLKIPRK